MKSIRARDLVLCFTLAIAGLVAQTARATSGAWLPSTGGVWTTGTNWSGGSYPDGVDQFASFTGNATAPTTVNVPTPITLGALTVGDSTAPFRSIFLASTGGDFTLDVSTGNAAITRVSTAGTETDIIYPIITLADNLDLTNANTSGPLFLAGSLDESTPGRTVNKLGGGVVVLLGNLTYTGATHINAGALLVDFQHTGAGLYTVAGGAMLGGYGHITGPGVSLGAGAFLSPGDPTGTLTIHGQLSTTGASATQNGAGDLVVTGGLAIAAGGALVKTGEGTATISGTQANGANSTLNASAGTVIMNSDAGSLGNLKLNLTAGGATTVATLNTTEHLKSVSASGGAKVELTASGGLYTAGNKYAHTGSLSIDATSTVDLGNGALIVNYTGNVSPYSAVEAKLIGSFDFGLWDLPGLVSSMAAFDATDGIGVTTVGIVDNTLLGYDSISGSHFSYDAVGNVPLDSVLVKFTYYGDSDLNGEVTADDLTNFFYGFDGFGTPSWVYGDFDYNGEVTADDFTLFLYGFDNQAGPLSGGGGPVAVPEPSSILLLVLGGLGLAWRERRRLRAV